LSLIGILSGIDCDLRDVRCEANEGYDRALSRDHGSD